ncbi:hypothetical protein C8F04DRAFT_1184752 [Mycena alexandri]|uniref:Uncharacterized protein n=1 Tax=Mycena alexandri TaxID=1745969 RepID=A0AAD6SW18_9AGAR|nr:hypothetical protein C8F04DRAFT_1184752 [Mycena alexandri]
MKPGKKLPGAVAQREINVEIARVEGPLHPYAGRDHAASLTVSRGRRESTSHGDLQLDLVFVENSQRWTAKAAQSLAEDAPEPPGPRKADQQELQGAGLSGNLKTGDPLVPGDFPPARSHRGMDAAFMRCDEKRGESLWKESHSIRVASIRRWRCSSVLYPPLACRTSNCPPALPVLCRLLHFTGRAEANPSPRVTPSNPDVRNEVDPPAELVVGPGARPARPQASERLVEFTWFCTLPISADWRWSMIPPGYKLGGTAPAQCGAFAWHYERIPLRLPRRLRGRVTGVMEHSREGGPGEHAPYRNVGAVPEIQLQRSGRGPLFLPSLEFNPAAKSTPAFSSGTTTLKIVAPPTQTPQPLGTRRRYIVEGCTGVCGVCERAGMEEGVGGVRAQAQVGVPSSSTQPPTTTRAPSRPPRSRGRDERERERTVKEREEQERERKRWRRRGVRRRENENENESYLAFPSASSLWLHRAPSPSPAAYASSYPRIRVLTLRPGPAVAVVPTVSTSTGASTGASTSASATPRATPPPKSPARTRSTENLRETSSDKGTEKAERERGDRPERLPARARSGTVHKDILHLHRIAAGRCSPRPQQPLLAPRAQGRPAAAGSIHPSVHPRPSQRCVRRRRRPCSAPIYTRRARPRLPLLRSASVPLPAHLFQFPTDLVTEFILGRTRVRRLTAPVLAFLPRVPPRRPPHLHPTPTCTRAGTRIPSRRSLTEAAVPRRIESGECEFGFGRSMGVEPSARSKHIAEMLARSDSSELDSDSPTKGGCSAGEWVGLGTSIAPSTPASA